MVLRVGRCMLLLALMLAAHGALVKRANASDELDLYMVMTWQG